MIDDTFFNPFDEGLKVVSACPVCKRRYDPVEARILMEKNDTHLLHMKCQSCSSSVLAVLMSNSAGMSSVGLVTDLSADEVMYFKNAQKVEYDDVITLHKLMKNNKVTIDSIR